jgi:hypothetical protein
MNTSSFVAEGHVTRPHYPSKSQPITPGAVKRRAKQDKLPVSRLNDAPP